LEDITMTSATAAAPTPVRSSGLAQLLTAGFAGGLVDLIYAFVVGGIGHRGPGLVLQSIASGWLGKASYHDGAGSMALGLVTHFGISTVMALVYALAALRLPVLYRRPWVTGPLYGLALYGVMYGIVLPLRWPTVFPKFDGIVSVTDALSHVGVGLAIALVLSRGTRRPTA
jgi:hypothetical protein